MHNKCMTDSMCTAASANSMLIADKHGLGKLIKLRRLSISKFAPQRTVLRSTEEGLWQGAMMSKWFRPQHLTSGWHLRELGLTCSGPNINQG